MRTLSATLLASQKSASRSPYVKVEVKGRVGGITRLEWSRLYNGSEPDFYHGATMPGDGSLVRARTDTAAYRLYWQRVTNPGPGSDFSTWSDLGYVSQASDIALCSQGSLVFLFYVASNQKSIYYRQSSDYGASFSIPSLILTATATVKWLAADFSDGGAVALFYSVGADIYVVKRTGTTWGSPVQWPHSISSVSGLDCVYQGDWNLLLSGKDGSSNYKVWTCVYGDGYSQPSGSWSSLMELTVASSGSDVEFHCPSLGFPDVFRTFFREKYTGISSYDRYLWSYSMATADFISNLWREPVPFNFSSNYGLALTHFGSYAWLSFPSGLWRAALSPSSVDISEDVVDLVMEAEPASGRVRIELRNDDGRYGGIGSGDYAAIVEGSEVLVSPGYRTAAGEEVSSGPAYWIEGWEYLSEGGRASFVLYARDGWGLLRHWRARRQFGWAAGDKNIFQLLSFIFARAGLEFSSFSNSSAVVNQYPAFTIHPGESGAGAVRRLLQMVPDVLFFRGNYGYLKNPQSSDASDYSCGTDHALWRGRYLSSSGANRVQVFGSGVLGEGFSWSDVEKVYDRLRQVHDLNLDTASEVEERAQAELRKETVASQGGEVAVPPNCGQELYDVVDISDERAGLSAAKRRVLGLTLRYSRGGKALYEQRLLLGGV